MVVTVATGRYTAILSGKGGGTGIGLVEVYKREIAAAAAAEIQVGWMPAHKELELKKSRFLVGIERNQARECRSLNRKFFRPTDHFGFACEPRLNASTSPLLVCENNTR